MISFNEQLVAQEFADEIKSGRLSVRDAYNNFWSYEEDKELWGVEGRALLPAWQKVIMSMGPVLEKGRLDELVKVVSDDYFKTKSNFKKRQYNPFLSDLSLASQFVVFMEETNPEVHHLMDEMRLKIKSKCETQAREILTSFVKVGEKSLPYLMEYISNQKNSHLDFALNALGEIGSKKSLDFLVKYISDSSNSHINRAIVALGKIGDESILPLLREFLLDEKCSYQEQVFHAIDKINGQKKAELLSEYILNQNNTNIERAFTSLRAVHTDQVIKFVIDYISNPHNKHVNSAIYCLGHIGGEAGINALSQYIINQENEHIASTMTI
ncbi:MAG: HEAT repeat domain-containing protein [Nanoarchaeota archaeon]|nr:HEAT repeat domain-containing protein [Nanoarchaeota archaeon]